MPNICNFDFRDCEQGDSKTIKGNLQRFDITNTTACKAVTKVFKMEFFHEKLASFKYPHCALLLTCENTLGQQTYMRVDRTQARDSCYVGESQANVRNGNPFRALSSAPEVIQERTFYEPIDFNVFRHQMLLQSSEDFTKIGRNCKWFSFTLWEHILNAHPISVYGSDDLYIIEQQKFRDCERIRAFMNWTYWFGSWFIQ